MRKFIFIPHCMRDAGSCEATFSDAGYTCAECGRCKIGDIVRSARQNGFSAFIVPGGSLVKKLYEKLDIRDTDVVVGVACETELRELRNSFFKNRNKDKKIAVRLVKDGCINTDVDLQAVVEILNRAYI